MESNLFEYIKNRGNEEILSLIKYRLNEKIYYYGDHFKKSKKISRIHFWINAISKYLYINITTSKLVNGKRLGLSSTYSNFDIKFKNYGFFIHRLPNNFKKYFPIFGGWKIFLATQKIEFAFQYRSFYYLSSQIFINKIISYSKLLKSEIQQIDYKFLLIPNDLEFYNKLFIKIFKELNKPSFLVSHGSMPSMYGEIDNSTDYILMKSQKEVESFIKMGYNSNKFFITGHSNYNTKPNFLKFGFENILVITKSINGVCPLEEPHLEDRGNIIMYLYAIQNVLTKMGIKNVRLRPHPSENKIWYLNFLDPFFFKIDNDSLSSSLSKSTLVIGPTSSVIIDALAHSINYLIFEPILKGKLITGFPITPPLDGKDPRIPIARNECELEQMILNQVKINLEVYDEFVNTNFNLSFFTDILKKWNVE